MPEFQNMGIGSTVMKNIIEGAVVKEKSIGLQAFKINSRAQKFYTGLGFGITSENEFNFVMKCNV